MPNVISRIYRRLEYPVPKSSIASLKPRSSNERRTLRTIGLFSSSPLSVTSKTIFLWLISSWVIHSIASPTISLFITCTNERLILTVKSGSILHHFLHCCTAWVIIHFPSGIISELSSRSGIKSTGDIKPYFSLFHLISASAPFIALHEVLNIG